MVLIITKVIFMLCVKFVIVISQPSEDEVGALPGLKTTPPFKHYSGFLDATGTRKLHYWYVESQNDPDNDPLLLWLNGGPGCSSLDGFLSELGPFHVRDDGATLYENPYSWNLVANVLFLESPAGVGYSYAEDKNYTTGDKQTAKDNYVALQSFFNKFPNRRKNPFYITGESYAGIYVPTLAVEVMNGNVSINLQGFAVGNGLHNATSDANTQMFFAYSHGIIGQDFWQKALKFCCSAGICDFNPRDRLTIRCLKIIIQAFNRIYNIGLNTYSIYMDCHGGIPPYLHRYQFDMKMFWSNDSAQIMSYWQDLPRYSLKVNPSTSKDFNRTKNGRRVGVDIPCINGTAQQTWLNRADVRHALHIPDFVQEWEVCSDEVNKHYRRDYQTMYMQYKSLLQKYRALVYNGDTDIVCNFLGAQEFVNVLGQKKKGVWREWVYNNQVAGFVQEFDTITVMTVKGAGHMVPQWKPPQALQMITNFLKNEPQ